MASLYPFVGAQPVAEQTLRAGKNGHTLYRLTTTKARSRTKDPAEATGGWNAREKAGAGTVAAAARSAQGIRSVIDPFGRPISYLRLSVTDRCDFRCTYCMAEAMSFLPKADVLTLEELERVCRTFIRLGVTSLRITGGEPLVRRDIMLLFRALGRRLKDGTLQALTLTTNGSQLARYAADLAACGVRRVNVSLDSLDPGRFQAITRRGHLPTVLDGIKAAREAGLQVKINTVALKGINDDEFDDLIAWCGKRGVDLCLIETMPLGAVGHERADRYLPLKAVEADLERRWTLIPSLHRSDGPARYREIAETGQRIGFITPMSHNFCESCNRVRVTCTGMLYLCLGQEDSADLRTPLRASRSDIPLRAAIEAAIARKPRGHAFVIERKPAPPAVHRFMSHTGG